MLTLIAATGLLTASAAVVAAFAAGRAATSFLLSLLLVAWVEVIVISTALSLPDALTKRNLLITLAALAASALGVAFRFRPRLRLPSWRDAAGTAKWVLGDPLLTVLAVVVALGLCYLVALALFTPHAEDDALFYHLARAAFWRQQEAVGYVSGTFDGRVNTYPPNAEIAVLFTMLTGEHERYAAFVQLLALLATMLAVYGVARRLGLDARGAAFGALLIPTLPVIALQASTAMNDIAVTAPLTATVYFALGRSRVDLALAGLAFAIAVGTKFSATFALPLVAAVALLAQPRRRWSGLIVAGVLAGLAGSYWYVLNIVETGAPESGGSGEWRASLDVPAFVARVARLGTEAVDASGARGRDVLVYLLVAAVLLVAGVVAAWRRRLGRAGFLSAFAAAAVAALAAAFPELHDLLSRAYTKAWLVIGDRELAYLDAGHDPTRADLAAWYGPLLVIMTVVASVLAFRRVRAGTLPRHAVLIALAPVVWLVIVAALLDFQSWLGRILMFGVALGAATWGLSLRVRPLAWSATAIASVSLLLALVHDDKKPAGLRLLDPDVRPSIWTTPRWQVEEAQLGTAEMLRIVHQRIPEDATIALAITPSDATFPFFGPFLRRTVLFASEAGAPPDPAGWLVVRPGRTAMLCQADWSLLGQTSTGWRVYRRDRKRDCVASLVPPSG